jgi:uncharacterized protein YbjQ (UPF0145 family)
MTGDLPGAGLTAEQLDQASIRELEAGRLPMRAQQRLAMITADQAFTSDLTVSEHHAIRSVGFSPVGQVLGACVYHLGYRNWDCGYGGYGGGWGYGSSSHVAEATGLTHALVAARGLALRRMHEECTALGGDGVVAVQLQIAPFLAGGFEFWAIGTAVRADGEVRPRTAFLSDLTGQDFAKLISAGYVPTGLVMGIAAMVRHDDWRTQNQTTRWYGNREVDGYTELTHTARSVARDRLAANAAQLGADGVVIRTNDLRIGEWSCNRGPGDDNRDHVAEALYIGTSIARFASSAGHAPPAPLPIMRLAPRRR